MMSLSDIPLRTIDGQTQTIRDYAGKAMLVVNVASQCGFTPQYEGLEALYRRYRDRGFVVLGFPCDQFGRQEPGAEAEIRNFCSQEYDVTFPLFAKTKVNGEGAHPLFKALKSAAPGLFGTPGDQMELHQVPDRQAGEGGEALRADRQTAGFGERHRAAIGLKRLQIVCIPSCGATARRRTIGVVGAARQFSDAPRRPRPPRGGAHRAAANSSRIVRSCRTNVPDAERCRR